jgi:hypothetical protein
MTIAFHESASRRATVRTTIREQLDRMAEVRRRLRLVEANHENHRGLTLRCSEKHEGGRSPKVAEVHATKDGIFFVSSIPWAKSDATTLRPWTEETHLSRLFADGNLDLDDDDLLQAAIDNLDWWKGDHGGPGDKSWIATREQRAHRIVEALDLPSAAGRLTLWVRCRDHLEDFDAVDPTRLVEALR